MNEAAAREVLLVQAFETAQPPSPSWSADDAEWSTRLALAGGAHSPETFIADRARHALQRLLPREPVLQRWLARRVWRSAWIVVAVMVGLVFGLLADSIGSSQRISLLAPPLWGVVLWNLVVYALLLVHVVRSLVAKPRRPGRVARWLQRSMLRGLPAAGSVAHRDAAALPATSTPPSSSSSPSALAEGDGALPRFAATWMRVAAKLTSARAATLLHAAAAALGLGLVAGLYLRGLVLDYRAAWESTFLSADAAHAALGFVLAPAVAVSGLALPDTAAFESLRAAHGGAAVGASAAVWIHLFAITLLGLVVLPRSALALWSGVRARWLSAHVGLPLNDPYFQRLLRHRSGDAARIWVLPYAQTPSAAAALGLRAVFARVFGESMQITIAPTVAFGAEDDEVNRAAVPAMATLAVALFDLSATPEAENHGRFAQHLAAPIDGADGTQERAGPAAPVMLLIDEAGFIRRFGAAGDRLPQRRAAWHKLAESLGTPPVFVNLDAPDLAAVEAAVQRALVAPVWRLANA
ncbi:hypothetical protein BH11PSE8_BH11PSE8_35130 [soil metagenome]